MVERPAWRRRIPRLRSMRFRALVVVVVVVLLPLALAALAGVEERSVGARLAETVREGVIDASADPNADAINEVAHQYGLRLRVLSIAATPEYDVDLDLEPATLSRLAARVFFGDDGAPAVRAFDKSLGPLFDRPEIRRAYDSTEPQVECRTSAGSKVLLCSAALRAKSWGGEKLFYAQRSSRRPVRALYDLRYELAKLVVVMLPVGLLLAWWLGARAVRPIEQLREQVLARAAGASAGPVSLPRRDEIGDLALAFNDLLGALDGRRREHEAFVADLVHELKTPVAAIRASAEQLEDGADPRTRRLAAAVDASARRLDALVTQLLELARAEGGLPAEPRRDVDVAALARGLVAAAKDDARWSGVRFTVRGPESAVVPAAEMQLDSAVRNLIENAASFALPEGEVDVAVDAAGDRVRVSVKDSGPGIAEADLPRVFDRFFTTRGRAHGTGLGLALVKAVALAHGGDARVEAGAGRGATFHVDLPKK